MNEYARSVVGRFGPAGVLKRCAQVLTCDTLSTRIDWKIVEGIGSIALWEQEI